MLDHITITITKAEGSTPREQGAYCIVSATDLRGTIGGGALEYHAIAVAREMLETGEVDKTLTLSLGPILGQCCGGRVELHFTKGTQAPLIMPQTNLYIFGKGHVGKALIEAVKPLPFNAFAYDAREGDDCEKFVREAEPNSVFLILTHSHALDFILTETALMREDALYVGLIGSKTKRARFVQSRGHLMLEKFHCPMGFKSLDKRPEVIAALTLAEILLVVSHGQ